MKKYLQISAVLGVLGLLVFFKQNNGSATPVATASNLNTTTQPSTSNSQTQTSSNSSGNTSYKNGKYTGSVQDAYYGNVQVQAVISNGKLSDVSILQYPNDNSTSQMINSQAIPYLTQEALQAQNANISGVSGASATSPAFIASLTDALSQAK